MTSRPKAVWSVSASASLTAMAWRGDGRELAAGSRDGSVFIIDASNGSRRSIGAHASTVYGVAFSPDGTQLLTSSEDTTIKLWDVVSGSHLATLDGPAGVMSVAWSPDGELACSADTKYVRIWSVRERRLLHILVGHAKWVRSALWLSSEKLVSAGKGGDLFFWSAAGLPIQKAVEHSAAVNDLALDSDVGLLATASADKTIGIWSTQHHRLTQQLEGHTDRVLSVSFSAEARLLASSGADGVIRIGTSSGRPFWEVVDSFKLADTQPQTLIRFSPSAPLLATFSGSTLTLLECDVAELSTAPPAASAARYANAKIVVVGNHSAGKSCLARALMSEPFAPQPSTHGMQVWNLKSEVCEYADRTSVVRETLLWDLAGQIDYQIVHQLFLEKTDVGVVVFDASDPSKPFDGVSYWQKALRRVAGNDCPLLLVAARTDVATPTSAPTEIERYRQENGFIAFIPTSAKTGDGVAALREAIHSLVPWDRLPVTVSPQMWHDLRGFLLRAREHGRMLMSVWDLREALMRATRVPVSDVDFDTVMRHAQAQGLVWIFTPGDLVLLRPELLNSYASAVVQEARRHPEGLGSVDERAIVEGRIDLSGVDRVGNLPAERSLLQAVVGLFLERQIALREHNQLVFPSKFTRNPPSSSDLPNPEAIFEFAGAVEQIYATLIVRLFYSGAFEWRQRWANAAEFEDARGNACGFFIDVTEGSSAMLHLFFGAATSIDSKILFTRFIQQHLYERALAGSVARHRIYYCGVCGHRVVDQAAVNERLRLGRSWVWCTYCEDQKVTLVDDLEKRFSDVLLLQRVDAVEHVVDRNTPQAQTRHVFLAHNRADKPQVRRIAEALKAQGIRVWFDEWEIMAGDLWHDEINRGLSQSASVAVFIGREVGKVQRFEMYEALQMAIDREMPVIPVFLPQASSTDLAFGVRSFSSVRFESDDDSNAMGQLVRSLIARQSAATA